LKNKAMFTTHDNSINDKFLIQQALEGNKKSLELLIKQHQNYIYNISLKLFLDPDDALDATQEILIKVVTNLKTFKAESNFKTWLYRIAFNYFLNTPKRKMERLMAENSKTLAGFSDESTTDSISEDEIEEVRIMCSTAMLMCLNREQRLIYIIGEVFGVDHKLGAELFNITPANYRVKLYRTKEELLNFVSGKCGLVNPENPCRCPKKTKLLVEKGVIDRQNLKYSKDFKSKIKDFVHSQKDEISDHIQLNLKDLFRDSPFQIKKELDNLLSEIVIQN
jgi:RNA polymerase sigma factor (sigma-70 family)